MKARRHLANWFNSAGNSLVDSKKFTMGVSAYKLAAKIDPKWSTPWYNLGLHAKYQSDWRRSLEYNKKAIKLNPESESALWNLGIAATALHDWVEARRAWNSYGIELTTNDGEVLMEPASGCVRLDPRNKGEVVWGRRLDPARFEILNVPLPDTNHRYRDIVLNDGASEGTRTSEDGIEVPVFNELAIWKPSKYSTYRVNLVIPSKEAERTLAEICGSPDIGVEDWSTIRFICAACSRGNPGLHECDAAVSEDGYSTYAFAAESPDELQLALTKWAERFPEADFRPPHPFLSALEQ